MKICDLSMWRCMIFRYLVYEIYFVHSIKLYRIKFDSFDHESWDFYVRKKKYNLRNLNFMSKQTITIYFRDKYQKHT